MPPVSVSPLSAEERESLADFLDEHTAFDVDYLLGFFHALGVAPSLLQPSSWLPVLVSAEAMARLETDDVNEFVSLILRQYNDVIDALEHRQLIAPDPADADACEAFAAGFTAAAELDPRWISDAPRWTFAAPFAYLAGRLDLVPPKMLADIELHLQPDPKQYFRDQITAMIATTCDTFAKYRTAGAPEPPVAHQHHVRVGRNQPCPCGSGRKYKRCCAGRAARAAR